MATTLLVALPLQSLAMNLVPPRGGAQERMHVPLDVLHQYMNAGPPGAAAVGTQTYLVRIVRQPLPPVTVAGKATVQAADQPAAPPIDIFRDAFGMDVDSVNDLVALAEGQNDLLLAEGPGTNQMPGGGPPPPGGPVATDAPTGLVQGPRGPATTTGGDPKESILEELEQLDAFINSLPTAQALDNLPRRIPLPADSSIRSEMRDALTAANLDPSNAEFTQTPDGSRVTWTSRRGDGDVVVTGYVEEGQIYLSRQFVPLTNEQLAAEQAADEAKRVAREAAAAEYKATQGAKATGASGAAPTTGTATTPSTAATVELPTEEQLDAVMKVAEAKIDAVYQAYLARGKATQGERLVQITGVGASIPFTDNLLGGLHAYRDVYARQNLGFIDVTSTLNMLPADKKAAVVQEMMPQASRVEYWQRLSDSLLSDRTPDGSGFRSALRQMISNAEGDAELLATLRNIEKNPSNWSELVNEQYLAALDQNPLLGINVDIGEPLWKVLTNGRHTDPAAYVPAFNTALNIATQNAHDEINRVSAFTTVEEFSEFLKPQYARTRAMTASVATGRMAELLKILDGFTKGFTEAKEGQAAMKEAAVNLFSVLVGGIGLLFAASAALTIRLGGAMLEAAGALSQLPYRLPLVAAQSTELANAQKGVAVIGPAAVAELQKKLQAQTGLTMLDLFFFGLAAGQLRVAIQEVRAAQAVERAKAAALADATAAMDGERRLANLIPGGNPAVVTDLTDGLSVLKRIDTEALAGRPGVKNPGDLEFFRDAGLVPQKTLEAGGQTFHITRPFIDGDGHIAVIAFQETGSGTVIPRTWYISNSHATWRVAPAVGQLINKGPIKMVDDAGNEVTSLVDARGRPIQVGTKFVNETSVDVAAEFLGPLSRWVDQQPILKLDPGIRQRAGWGHLEEATEGAEFGSLINRSDVEVPLPPGTRPDIQAGPLDRWSLTHPEYGRLEGFLFRSEKGDALFVVLRNEKGQVWIGGIQVGDEFITRFGNRASAYLVDDLTKPPLEHGAGGYVQQGFGNEFTKALTDALPPPGAPFVPRTAPAVTPGAQAPTPIGSAPAAGARTDTPTVINPGRQPGTVTFTTPRPGMPTRAVPVQQDDALLVNARAEIQNGYQQQWKGLELQRIQEIVRNPAGFRSTFGHKLTPEDVSRFQSILDKYLRAAIPAPAARELGRTALNANQQGMAPAQAAAQVKNEIARTGVSSAEAARGIALEFVRRASRMPTGATPITPQSVPIAGLTPAAAAASIARNVTLTFTALGKASGESFRMNATNNGATPVILQGAGVVIEPIGEAPARPPQTASAQNTNGTTATLEAYCLDRPLAVAPEGMQYRIASPALQAKSQPLVHIIEAGHRLHQAGRLNPDSNADTYREFAIQWGIWSEQEKLDQKKFTDLFLNQTKTNVEATGAKWNRQMEDVVRQAAPNRWKDIVSIREEANRTKNASKPSIGAMKDANPAGPELQMRSEPAAGSPIAARMNVALAVRRLRQAA